MIIVYMYGACLVFGLCHAVEVVYKRMRQNTGKIWYLKNKGYGEENA